MNSGPSGSQPFSPWPLQLLTQDASCGRLFPFLLHVPSFKSAQGSVPSWNLPFPSSPSSPPRWGAGASCPDSRWFPGATLSVLSGPVFTDITLGAWNLRGRSIYSTDVVSAFSSESRLLKTQQPNKHLPPLNFQLKLCRCIYSFQD